MTLSPRQIRLLLRSATGLLCAAAVGVLGWAWQTPIATTTAVEPVNPQSRPVDTTALPRSVALEEFADLWLRPLRGPLEDPVPVPMPIVVPEPVTPPQPKPIPRQQPPPKLEIRLVGTVIEAGRSMAIVTDASGKIDLKRSGEVLDLEPAGIRVDEIQADSVTVSYQGRQSQLSLEKTSAGGKAKRRDRK